MMPVDDLSRFPLEFGCRTFRGSAEELFERYLELGFIYPEKRLRLEPVWDRVIETWRGVLSLPPELSVVAEFHGPTSRSWTTLHIWKHTASSWQVQHLASSGGALGSRAAILDLQDYVKLAGGNATTQNWFSPGNRYANRIFGSVDTFGPGRGEVVDPNYFRLDLKANSSAPTEVVERLGATEPDLVRLARSARGDLYVRAEELAGDDLELARLDDRYRHHGLRRTRRVFVVRDRDGIAGAALVYRGSLGINLSMLENRTELLMRPGLDEAATTRIISALIDRAREEYADFEAGFLPLTASSALEEPLLAQGARLMRRYRQGTWSRETYRQNRARMDRFFDRITRRAVAR